MRRILTCVFLLTPVFAYANPDAFVGKYGLEFSDDANKAALVITKNADQFDVQIDGEVHTVPATVLAQDKIDALWERLSLSAGADKVSCLKFERDVLCNISDDVKNSEPHLAGIKSNYFFYSIMHDEPITAYPLK